MKVCRLRVPCWAMLDSKIGKLATNSNPRESLDFPSIRARIPPIVISNSKAIQSVDDSSSSSSEISRVCVQVVPILNQEQFNQIISHHSSDAIVILWMASWCRKCIYLKPKLEKMAADYFPRICFYSVDVNAVPHKLVTMANVSKMPTIQVWKDKKKQGEVIGGHKAYLVVNEVCDIIDNLSGDSP